MSVMKSDLMMQNARITAFTAFELFRENQLGDGGVKMARPPRLTQNKC